MPTLKDITSPDRGVIFLDKSNNVTYANSRASEIFSMPLSSLVGSKLPIGSDLGLESPETVVEEVLEDTIQEGVIFHRYSTPVWDTDGTVAGRIETFSDITARRNLEAEILETNEELARLYKQLKAAQEQLIHSERLRTLGEMAAGVAHDINNSLAIIIGNAQMAKRVKDDPGRLEHCINSLELAAKDAAQTVHMLREIGRPVDTGTYEPVDLSQIAREVVESALPAWKESGKIRRKDMNVYYDLAEECVVTGNPVELREALANMLINAAQAVSDSGDITVRTINSEGSVELSVIDQGIGMDEETKEQLFDPFFTTRGADGTGLGMSMVEAIAIRHNGRVTVESEIYKGTTITLRIPAASH